MFLQKGKYDTLSPNFISLHAWAESKHNPSPTAYSAGH